MLFVLIVFTIYCIYNIRFQLRHNKVAGYFLLLAYLLNLYSFIRVVFGDPGISDEVYKYYVDLNVPMEKCDKTFRQNNKVVKLFDERFDHRTGEFISVPYCSACKDLIHIGTMHCIFCRLCIREYDHHCGYLGKCVGKNNIAWFNLGIRLFFFIIIYIFGMTTWILYQN